MATGAHPAVPIDLVRRRLTLSYDRVESGSLLVGLKDAVFAAWNGRAVPQRDVLVIDEAGDVEAGRSTYVGCRPFHDRRVEGFRRNADGRERSILGYDRTGS